MTGLIREAFLAAAAQKLASFVTLVLVAAMCAAVLMTSGKVEGNQQSVLATIDSAGTRSIVVRTTSETHLDSDILDRFSAIDGVEAAVALGTARDVRNALLPDGAPVPLRDYWGERFGTLSPGEALASPAALHLLGMRAPVGAVANKNGIDVAVVGPIADPSFLADYEPLLLTPRARDDVGRVSVLVIVTTDATAVEAVTDIIRPIVSGPEVGEVTISSSEQLASLRGSISEQLGAFGAVLTAGSLLLAGALVSIVQSALVMLRRKDWGRRRALGASRSLITALIMTQTGVVSLIGVLLGVGGSLLALLLSGDPLPSLRFSGAVAMLAFAVSLAAALIPAAIASRRDPIKELRVP